VSRRRLGFADAYWPLLAVAAVAVAPVSFPLSLALFAGLLAVYRVSATQALVGALVLLVALPVMVAFGAARGADDVAGLAAALTAVALVLAVVEERKRRTG
jgi:hypothetical protein